MLRSTHRLGLRGQFTLDDHSKVIAARFGLMIEAQEANRFVLRGNIALGELCPDFVRHNDGVFDKKNLQLFLQFLHQPVRTTLEKLKTRPDEDIHEHRVMVHKMLRLMTTGSVRIAPERYAELEKSAADCHADEEREVRDLGLWSAQELGGEVSKSSCIPHTAIDLRKGFELSLHPQNADLKRVHEPLRDVFKEFINMDSASEKLLLNARMLQQLCRYAYHHTEALQQKLDLAEYEEARAEICQRIAQGTQDTPTPANLPVILAACALIKDRLDHEDVKRLWRRKHIMERHDIPLSALSKDYNVMRSILEDYATKGIVERSRALKEFAPLLSLFAVVANSWGAPGLMAELKKSGAFMPKTINKAYAKLAKAVSARRHPNIKDQGLKMIVYGTKAAALAVPHAAKDMGVALLQTLWNVMAEVVNFTRESPRVALPIGGLMLGLNIYLMSLQREYSEAKSEANYANVMGQRYKIKWEPGQEEARLDISWHEHIKLDPATGAFITYKHFTSGNFVKKPALQLLDLQHQAIQSAYNTFGIQVNYNSHFMATSQATVQKVAGFLFWFNNYQNLSHCIHWGLIISISFGLGPRGVLAKVNKLGAPLINIHYQFGASALATLRIIAPNTLEEKSLLPVIKESKNLDLTRPEPQKQGLRNSFIAASALSGVCMITGAALDMAGKGNALTDQFSRAAAIVESAAVTTTCFTVFNTYEDVVVVHLGTDWIFALAGAAAGVAYRRMLKPSLSTITEWISPARPYFNIFEPV